MKRKHVRWITLGVGIPAIILMMLAEVYTIPVLALIGLTLFLGVLLFEFCMNRCPYCGRYLGGRRRIGFGLDEDGYCPRCGKRPDDEDEV